MDEFMATEAASSQIDGHSQFPSAYHIWQSSLHSPSGLVEKLGSTALQLIATTPRKTTLARPQMDGSTQVYSGAQTCPNRFTVWKINLAQMIYYIYSENNICYINHLALNLGHVEFG